MYGYVADKILADISKQSNQFKGWTASNGAVFPIAVHCRDLCIGTHTLAFKVCHDTAGFLHMTMYGDVWADSTADADDSGKLYPDSYKAHSENKMNR